MEVTGMSNTLAYCGTEFITTVKIIIVQAFGAGGGINQTTFGLIWPGGGPYLATDEDVLRFPHLAKVPPIKNDHKIVLRSSINTTPVL
jgi:hypothetical protein